MGEFEDSLTGIYVISRSSGENYDRKNETGDFKLTDNELSNIKRMSEYYTNSILLLNVGGVIDTSFIDECPLLDSVVLVSQLGMTTGDAVADIIDGTTTPSGKLTDTWAYSYDDYPTSENFGMENPKYVEGIYVGYRYFDSFNVKPRYEFGYGLSYADFYLKAQKVNVNEKKIKLSVNVENTGNKYSGREVVQVYVSKPQTGILTSYQDLICYEKRLCYVPMPNRSLILKLIRVI